MKALTIKQPWAQLIMRGGKDSEKRQWPTSVRGRIAIHSSKAISKQEIKDACDFMRKFIPKFSERIFTAEALGYSGGCVLGTVDLVDCVRKSDSPWFCGDYGFVLRNPQLLPVPVPATGQLGFWEWEQTVIKPEFGKKARPR